MAVCDVTIISTISRSRKVTRSCHPCYYNSKRLLVIVSTLVLRLKAAEFFLRPVSALLRTQQRGHAKKTDYEM